jgi:acetaldehyde dehydrogenase (acetylating)
MRGEGAYFTNEQETEALRRTVFHPDGSMNTAVVAKSAAYIATYAGFKVPAETRILVTPISKVGKQEPLSLEKLTTVLGWYEADGWEQGCDISMAFINTGGRGHTQIVYANDERVIMAFGLEKPVFRILVNTMGTLGAIGLTTGMMPSLTLGSGGVGGSITGDNVTAYHLINIKRLAYETSTPPLEAFHPGPPSAGPAPEEIERVVRQVVNEFWKANKPTLRYSKEGRKWLWTALNALEW